MPMVDPLCEKYYSMSPYAYCANNPIRYIDPTGEAWKETYLEDDDGNKIPNGYEWIDEKDSYDKSGKLLDGLYVQAIFFSDNFTFNSNIKKNIGSSTATVYKADGTTEEFKANTLPSDQNLYATIPDGTYHATVGLHKGAYSALRMSDTDNTSSIELGMPNPAHPERTTAVGINIHKAGKNNLTGMVSKKVAVSQGCLLMDRTKWSSFINIFNNESQKTNKVSVTVSRYFSTPRNENRKWPALNFKQNLYQHFQILGSPKSQDAPGS